MKAPLSWIKDYIDLDDFSIEEIARVLTMIGLEVEEIQLIGLDKPDLTKYEFKYDGLSWPEDKFIVAQVDAVMPHPDADRLVLCKLFDGFEHHVVLTGAPNLFPFKGAGSLEQPLKVAYAKEGAILYDGHQNGNVKTKLKRMKIRGVESFSMICSEKELGISDEHEGVILLDHDAPVGMSLMHYMGDAVFDIKILPNMVRDASLLGMARELSAALRKPLKEPICNLNPTGPSIVGRASLEIHDPELNPRFILGLAENIKDCVSPYWVQRRLRLAGMRPINAVVDATNYTMLETGEPLHAFDFDVLKERANGESPKIITRTAIQGEQLRTLDGNTYDLDSYMVLVSDSMGPLSLAGVMGGIESEVTSGTKNVLLEGASWNFINIRKTVSKLKISSEAAYRFSRGIHPALAEQSVKLCLSRLQSWSNAEIASELIDSYPSPPIDPIIELTALDVNKILGTEVPPDETVDILNRLGFNCESTGEVLEVKTPPSRLDISAGVVGRANLIEEISRIYGFDRIPSKRLAAQLPPQVNNKYLENEEIMRDLLVNLGLQEVIAYRQTSPEREARILPDKDQVENLDYVEILNPITPDRCVMRRSILATMLEIIERNVRLTQNLGMFEIGPVFIPKYGEVLPVEALRLSIGLTGLRDFDNWQHQKLDMMDFFDLKGIIEALLEGMHIPEVIFKQATYASFHPGKCAEVYSNDQCIGVFGELHPLVKSNYDFSSAPVLAADLDANLLLEIASYDFVVKPISIFPAMVEDIAVIVDKSIPSNEILKVIQRAGGKLLSGVKLFDVYHDEKIGINKKSMAYKLYYQAYDRTLTDKDALTIRNKIVRALMQEFNAVLRSQ
jgi:phenylalanyl-tRNA synthetase beta chain